MLSAPGGLGSIGRISRDDSDQGPHHSRCVRMGHMLGGHGHTTAGGIRALQPYADDQARCVLLCMEEHPADCHRHRDATRPHFPGALHIYRDRLFFYNELSRVDAGEIGFDALMSGSWDDWLDVLRNHP